MYRPASSTSISACRSDHGAVSSESAIRRWIPALLMTMFKPGIISRTCFASASRSFGMANVTFER